ncbi:MAG: 16S rRNA (guanine(527)-N(7))-methyltransferase RsmG [Betaproteobacteria bacterium]|nr:16S rRNA (guanine(527)-N(7))-methyltransferase RsmG [Betaproteobacteria bacterium]
MSLESQLGHGVAVMGITLPEGAVDRLAQYLRLLEKWNRVHNLTAIRDLEQMVTLHVLDSLSVLPYVAGAHTLVDVGTGAGLPGIPLAIARPDLRVTLLDSSHKKATFLEQARMELKLENIAVACERVERWHPQAKFDAVVSRAFAELADFVQGARHLVAPEGRMLAMKGVHPFDEIARLPDTCRLDRVVELAVPTLEAKRHLVLLVGA